MSSSAPPNTRLPSICGMTLLLLLPPFLSFHRLLLLLLLLLPPLIIIPHSALPSADSRFSPGSASFPSFFPLCLPMSHAISFHLLLYIRLLIECVFCVCVLVDAALVVVMTTTAVIMAFQSCWAHRPFFSFLSRGVGCIFFEMASGRPLFPGSTVEDQLQLIFNLLGINLN